VSENRPFTIHLKIVKSVDGTNTAVPVKAVL